MLLQFILGITTLLTQVNLHVAATHQAVAMILLIALTHQLHKKCR